VEIVKTIGMPDDIKDQKANSYPQRKTQNMDCSSDLIAEEVSPGDFEVVLEHDYVGYSDFKILAGLTRTVRIVKTSAVLKKMSKIDRTGRM
jgi:hypothetical protein